MGYSLFILEQVRECQESAFSVEDTLNLRLSGTHVIVFYTSGRGLAKPLLWRGISLPSAHVQWKRVAQQTTAACKVQDLCWL